MPLNNETVTDKDAEITTVPLKVNVLKVFRWQCPHCLRDNMETEVPDKGLLFCKCTRVLKIGSVENDKIFYLNNRDDEECYLLNFEDYDKPNEIFTDVKAAMDRFVDAKQTWSCQLFGILMKG